MNNFAKRALIQVLLVITVSASATAGLANPQESDSAKVYHTLGLNYFKAKRYQQAIEPLVKAIQLAPAWAQAHNDLGMSYYMLGRFADAVECFKKAVQNSPNYSIGYYNLGGVYR